MGTAIEFVNVALKWLGRKESDSTHKEIIDIYNAYTPLPRGYKVKYTDPWCATFVSAVAIKGGFTDIIPLECSCYYMIEKAKKMGIWAENDDYNPKLGTLILYDWDDNGKGDNTGVPDHVGIVVSNNGDTLSVIEGNYSNSVKVRTVKLNDKNIRGFIVPKFSKETKTEPTKQKTFKDYALVSIEVIEGKCGNGTVRTDNLKKKGYDPVKVQKIVNTLLS